MSTPQSTCFCTTSATASRTRAWKAASSPELPCSRARIISMRSAGRGRLPVWVVRIRSVLLYISLLFLIGGRVLDAGYEASREVVSGRFQAYRDYAGVLKPRL